VAKRKSRIIEDAINRFEIASTAETDNRQSALESLRFKRGEQWSESDLQERKLANRPALTINKTRIIVNRVVGDIIQNLPSMRVIPVETGDFGGAQVRQELIRHIERTSGAEDIVKLAAEQAVTGGFGYYRLFTRFTDDETFDQDIVVEPIRNQFTVYLDQSAKDYTYEDGNYAFISEMLTKEEFERKYPKASTIDFMGNTGNLGEQFQLWHEPEKVRVAEFFWKEPVKKTIVDIQNRLGEQKTIELSDDVTRNKLRRNGWAITRERTADSHKVMWAKVTSHDVLEGPVEFPSKYIPIIPVFGYEDNVEGKRKYVGIVSDMIDSQRMLNFFYTSEVESVTQQTKAPWLGTDLMFSAKPDVWATAGTKSHAVLTAKPDPRVPGGMPVRTAPPVTSSGHLTHIQLADNDMKDTSGIHDASLGKTSNERSGRAILARQRGSDITTITFKDNVLKSVRYAGKILLDMLPRVYDNQRVFRLIGDDGQLQDLFVNFEIVDPATLEVVKVNDISEGKYDYIADAGVMFMTKRQESVASLLQVLQFAPFYAQVLAPKIIEMLDIPDAVRLANELKGLAQQQQQQELAQAQGGSPPGSVPQAEGALALPGA
jgi:hypothetical protein